MNKWVNIMDREPDDGEEIVAVTAHSGTVVGIWNGLHLFANEKVYVVKHWIRLPPIDTSFVLEIKGLKVERDTTGRIFVDDAGMVSGVQRDTIVKLCEHILRVTT